jgi:hypothetical protein
MVLASFPPLRRANVAQGITVSNYLSKTYAPDHGIIRRQGHFQVNESRPSVLVTSHAFHRRLILRAAHKAVS